MPERPSYRNTRASFQPNTRPSKRPNERTEPRRWLHDGFIPFRLEILTPVFIGSGDDLSPLDYVIRKEGDGYVLHLVDTESWLLNAQNSADVCDALDKGDMLKLRRLLDEQLDTALYSFERIPIPSNATAEALRATIRNPRSMSKAEVQPFVRNPATMAAFVPGSSLKGALTTPLIDKLDNGGLKNAIRSSDKRAYTKKLEEMFGNIHEHAMQAIKVSDIPVPPGGTRLVAAAEVRLEAGKTGTPKTPCETLMPSADGGLALYGRLFMEMVHGKPCISLQNGATVSLTELADLCNTFYGRRFRAELDKFYRLSHLTRIGTELQPVLRRIASLDPTKEFLLRVGHYSHVECVTVSNNAPQSSKGFGKTRTLADRRLPFGWVVLNFCDEEEYREGLDRVEASVTTAARERETRRSVRDTEMHKAMEEQHKLAEAAAQAKAKEEERKAKLAALSPEERAIAEVAAPEATEAQSIALYAQLDSLDEDLRNKAAVALRDCWKRLGKWEGKLSKKQKEKVSKVRQLLEK